MTMPQTASIVILSSHGVMNYALINSLAKSYCINAIVFENPGFIKLRLLFNRLRKLGPIQVLDQLLFKLLDVLYFQRTALPAAQEILGSEIWLDASRLPEARILDVKSINAGIVRKLIRDVIPDVIVVSGTTLIGREALAALGSTPVLNIHCGITPRYRGVHGAYWAIVNGDWNNIGTTVHLVDEGVDTGGIVFQDVLAPEPNDTVRTLVLKQYRIGIRLVSEAIGKAFSGEMGTIRRDDLDSRLYSSPTFTSYLRYRKRMRERFSVRQGRPGHETTEW